MIDIPDLIVMSVVLIPVIFTALVAIILRVDRKLDEFIFECRWARQSGSQFRLPPPALRQQSNVVRLADWRADHETPSGGAA